MGGTLKRSMIKRIRSGSTKTLYTWIDMSIVKASIPRPRKRQGAIFLMSMLLFVFFLSCITYIVMRDTRIGEAWLVRAAISKAISGDFKDVQSLADVRQFVRTKFLPLIRERGASEWATFLDTNVVVGSVRAVQHRSAANWTCDDALYRSLLNTPLSKPAYCRPDFDARQLKLEPGFSFRGPRTKIAFPYVTEQQFCPPGLACSIGTASRVHPDRIFYPYSGFAIDFFQGLWFANETIVNAVGPQGDPFWADFFDDHTRHVRLSALLFNPQYNLFSQFDVHFELPVTGGVYPFLNVQFLTLVDRSTDIFYTFAEVFVWLYAALHIFLFVLRVLMGVIRRAACLRCRITDTDIPVTRCWKCEKPVPVSAEQHECTWCGQMLTGIIHQCWRAQAYEPWSLLALLNVGIFIVARSITLVARAAALEAAEKVGRPTSTTGKLVPTVLFSPVAQLSEIASDFLAAVLILTFTLCYRYLGRAAWCARILRVFSRGGFLISSFFLTFAIVFVGFSFAFHVMLATASDAFDTMPHSLRSTFNAFIMILNWYEIGFDTRRWTFFCVYVAFVFACSLVMLNVLISIVTFEYKVSCTTVAYDVEAESLALILQPLYDWYSRYARYLHGQKKDDGKKDKTKESASSVVAVDLVEELREEDEMTLLLRKTTGSVEAASKVLDTASKEMDERLDGMQDQVSTLNRFIETCVDDAYERKTSSGVGVNDL